MFNLKWICDVCECEERPDCYAVYGLSWETCNYCPLCEDIKGYWLHNCPVCDEVWCEDTMQAEDGSCGCDGQEKRVFPGWVHLCECTIEDLQNYVIEKTRHLEQNGGIKK